MEEYNADDFTLDSYNNSSIVLWLVDVDSPFVSGAEWTFFRFLGMAEALYDASKVRLEPKSGWI